MISFLSPGHWLSVPLRPHAHTETRGFRHIQPFLFSSAPLLDVPFGVCVFFQPVKASNLPINAYLRMDLYAYWRCFLMAEKKKTYACKGDFFFLSSLYMSPKSSTSAKNAIAHCLYSVKKKNVNA